jgi:hypothetical protein
MPGHNGYVTILLALLTLAQTVTFDSPRDYQVFQRQTRDSGSILLKGTTTSQTLEVRLPHSRWTRIPVDPATHRFDAALTAHAGDFYVLEYRAGKTHGAIPHVGIGEVFVVAGQSNATNYGEVKQQTKSRMVVSFNGESWAIGDDPQPGVQDNSHNGSFIPAFGDALYARYHVPIAVACVGHGSTSVRQWLPKGDRMEVQPTMTRFVTPVGPHEWESTGQLFDGMLRRIDQFGPQGFRALLWHQGESDAHQKPEHDISGDTYRTMIERVIRASRERAGWDFPWFVAQASYHTPDDPSCPEIRDAQQAVWRDGLAFPGPDTDTLTGLNRQNQGKGVHFSDTGLRVHGQLWADKVAAWLDTILK